MASIPTMLLLVSSMTLLCLSSSTITMCCHLYVWPVASSQLPYNVKTLLAAVPKQKSFHIYLPLVHRAPQETDCDGC